MSKKEQRELQASIRQKELEKEGHQRREIAAYEMDPIKQYVRKFGWGDVIDNFIKKMRQEGVTRPWKYLTLPGEYALDIAYLDQRNLLSRTEDGKLCVAICDEMHGEEVRVALEQKGGLLASSFESLEKALSNPYTNLAQEFPFDVINLDFCKSIFRVNKDHLHVLDSIFKFQQGQSFLLLITSRPDKNQGETYKSLIENNLLMEEGFRNSYQIRFGDTNSASCMQNYKDFELIAIPKVVAKIAREMSYKVSEHFVCTYRRTYDLVSEAFELEPIGKASHKWFEPRFSLDKLLLGRDGSLLDEALGEDLVSARVKSRSYQEYSDFITVLPYRAVDDINEKLNVDESLSTELLEESLSLQSWIGY
ncbi:MAG: hypothetical protein H0S79_06265 [Anaerolineaceae bacterium]|nr:hypothetical protein [Anaerolineaceae bacterium]